MIPKVLHEHIDTAFPANVCLIGVALPDGYAQISLSAAPEQVAFYQQFGFETVGENDHAVTMIARLT